MSDEYIKKEYAVNHFEALANSLDTFEFRVAAQGAVNELRKMPSTCFTPVRHGHWIIKCVREYELSDGGTAYVPEYECSCCGFLTESYVRLDEPIMPEDADFPKYCEYCGARMDKEATDGQNDSDRQSD